VKRTAIALYAAALVAAPRVAAACACQQEPDRLSSTLKIVGAFMLVPFLIAGVVWFVLKSAPREPQP
jgi:hypothetical protein